MTDKHLHDKRLYIKRSDFQLWEDFSAKYGDQKSSTILKLVRLLMEGGLYLEDGRQVKL